MSVDRPVFLPESVTGTREERISETILGIKKLYQGVPNDSPQAEALRNITTLTGLFIKRKGVGVGILQAIIQRRKTEDEAYREALERLDGLTAACLREDKGDKLMTMVTALDDRLHALVAELFPEPRLHSEDLKR